VKQDLKKIYCWHCSIAAKMEQALVFTRTKHRANRLASSW